MTALDRQSSVLVVYMIATVGRNRVIHEFDFETAAQRFQSDKYTSLYKMSEGETILLFYKQWSFITGSWQIIENYE